MTEEDQKLVAIATLHGARFMRNSAGYWISRPGEYGRVSIGRAAADYILTHALLPAAQCEEYLRRTGVHKVGIQEIDPAFIASVMS